MPESHGGCAGGRKCAAPRYGGGRLGASSGGLQDCGCPFVRFSQGWVSEVLQLYTAGVPWCHGFEPYPLLIVLSFPQNSSKTVRHSYQFETVPEPCMRAAKQLAVLVFCYLATAIIYGRACMHARSANLHAGARSEPEKFMLILALVTIKKSGLQSLRALNHARLHITISDAKQLI